MVLFAKVVISTLALLPFFVFIEKRLGQHCPPIQFSIAPIENSNAPTEFSDAPTDFG